MYTHFPSSQYRALCWEIDALWALILVTSQLLGNNFVCKAARMIQGIRRIWKLHSWSKFHTEKAMQQYRRWHPFHFALRVCQRNSSNAQTQYYSRRICSSEPGQKVSLCSTKAAAWPSVSNMQHLGQHGHEWNVKCYYCSYPAVVTLLWHV